MITITKFKNCIYARVENPVEITCPPGIVSARIRRFSPMTTEQLNGEHGLILAIIDEAIRDLTLIGRKYLSLRTEVGDFSELNNLTSARLFFRPADSRFAHKRFDKMCAFLGIDSADVIEALEIAGYLPPLRINTIELPRLELKKVCDELREGFRLSVKRTPRTSEFVVDQSTPQKEAVNYGV